MTRLRITRNLRSVLCVMLAAVLCCGCRFSAFAEFTYYADRNKNTTESALDPELATDVELSRLQDQYEQIEQKIEEGEKAVEDVQQGKKEQSESIKTIQSNINDLNGQIEVLEKKVDVLDTDINRLNSSINVLNEEITKLNADISELEDKIFDTTRTTDILYGKIKSRLIINYMVGKASNLEVMIGVRDLPSFFTKLEIIRNLSRYDREILNEYEEQLKELQNMNAELSADKAALDTKESALSGEKQSLSARQADMESSQYVLDMKKKLSEHRYQEAVDYLHSLDETSSDYTAMLNMLNKEQDKVDEQINAYLLKHGSSADDATRVESVTQNAGDGTSITQQSSEGETTTTKSKPFISAATTAPTKPKTTEGQSLDVGSITFGQSSSAAANVVSPESMHLIWPLPYKNCYISAYYGQYPSGGPHHGLDICVRGGTEGKNVVAAADGVVISYGFNHWSMGNYVILDHGNGLFTAYYHMQRLYVAQGDRVKQGQVIGLAGHTGNTTGPHLHFEVRISRGGQIIRMNPLKFVSLPS